MNTLRNMPVLVRGSEEGGYVAECLLLPDCRCFGVTRQQALETMQTLVQSALRTQKVLSNNYEIVHLAIGRVSQPPPPGEMPAQEPSQPGPASASMPTAAALDAKTG